MTTSRRYPVAFRSSVWVFAFLAVRSVAFAQPAPASPGPAARYTIAFASFAPLDTDLFLAEADGSAARPLSPHPNLDYNASFSPDGRWIVFTSHRDGSADIFRVRPDGLGPREARRRSRASTIRRVLSPGRAAPRFRVEPQRSGGRVGHGAPHEGAEQPHESTGRRLSSRVVARRPTDRLSSIRDEASFDTPGAGRNPYDIFVMRADGTDVRRITDSHYAGSPSWLPDGSGLVYYQTTVEDLGSHHLAAPHFRRHVANRVDRPRDEGAARAHVGARQEMVAAGAGSESRRLFRGSGGWRHRGHRWRTRRPRRVSQSVVVAGRPACRVPSRDGHQVAAAPRRGSARARASPSSARASTLRPRQAGNATP